MSLIRPVPALVLALILAALCLAAAGPAYAVSQEDKLFLAADAFYLGDFKRAAESFRDVLESDPDNAFALSRLGASLAALGQDGQAMAALDAALAKHPDHLFARTFKGALLLRTGDGTAAESLLDKALREAPEYPQALFFHVVSRLAAGDNAAALDGLAALARRDHPEAEVHAATAALLARLGLLDAAKLEWERALALRPSEPVWMIALGSLLARQGKEKLAVTAFEQVLAMGQAGLGASLGTDPGASARAATYLATAFSGLAWQAADEGRPQDALALCRMALRADPGQAGCLYLARAGGSPERAAKDAEARDAAARETARAKQAQAAPSIVPVRPEQSNQSNQPAQSAQSGTSGQAAGPAQPGQPVQPGQAVKGEAMAIVGAAKLRVAPGPDSPALMVLRQGAAVTVVARQGDWAEVVSASGRRGFVRADLLGPAKNPPTPGQ